MEGVGEGERTTRELLRPLLDIRTSPMSDTSGQKCWDQAHAAAALLDTHDTCWLLDEPKAPPAPRCCSSADAPRCMLAERADTAAVSSTNSIPSRCLEMCALLYPAELVADRKDPAELMLQPLQLRVRHGSSRGRLALKAVAVAQASACLGDPILLDAQDVEGL